MLKARWLRCWKVLVEMAKWGIEHRSGKHVVSDVTLNELLMNACHTCGVWDRLKPAEIG